MAAAELQHDAGVDRIEAGDGCAPFDQIALGAARISVMVWATIFFLSIAAFVLAA